VSSKRVPQTVRADMHRDPASLQMLFNAAPYASGRHPFAPVIKKDRIFAFAGQIPILFIF
jgi:hypothetical protein